MEPMGRPKKLDHPSMLPRIAVMNWNEHDVGE
jgi:hypothetical protein